MMFSTTSLPVTRHTISTNAATNSITRKRAPIRVTTSTPWTILLTASAMSGNCCRQYSLQIFCHTSVCCSTAYSFIFFFSDTGPTEIYTLSLHDALPICAAAELDRPAVDVDDAH